MNPRKTRILQVLECGGPGGTGNQVSAIVRGLDPDRFETTLVYNVRPGASAEEFERQAAGPSRKEDERRDGHAALASAAGACTCIRVPEMVREISPREDLSALLRLRAIFRERRPDVVHAHSSKAGYLARAAGLLAGVPRVLYSPRGYSFLQLDRSPASRRLYRTLEASVAWIGEIVACSPSEARYARSLGTARRVRVVRDAYLGQLPPERPPRGSGTPWRICAAGRLSPPKNPEAFVRLAARLAALRPDVRCLWIGDGELAPRVRALAAELGLGEKFELTGWLPHADALGRIQHCDVFVHYSGWEGLPNAVLDAFACGLPVVASDIPGNRDLVRSGENGWIAKDEELLFERVRELLETPDRRSELGRRGRTLIEKEFHVSRLIAELSRVYTE
ncbi:MAG: glycosyltransferase [Elusimicrobiota bacterium]